LDHTTSKWENSNFIP